MPCSAADAPAGQAHLGFLVRDEGGPTVLARRHATHPLAVQRAVYGDPGLPGQPQVYLQNNGGGVLAGDDLCITVDLGPGACARIGGVGATRLHPGPAAGTGGTQRVDLRLGAGACLEWLPDPVIPFAHSVSTQTLRVRLGAGAQWIGWDILAPGRMARGERFAYDVLRQALQVREEPSGRLLLAERSHLEPARQALDGPGVLAGRSTVGALRVVTTRVPAAVLVAALRAVLEREGDVYAGATALPASGGAILRVLGLDIQPVARVLHAAWDAARRLVLGVPAPVPRRY